MENNLYKREIYLITGPTAVGKTELSLEIAQILNAEIISVDSMQIYKYFDIGTAKPSPKERKLVPHHLIDFVDPADDYDVAQFVSDAEKKIVEIWQKNKEVLLVGGTMMYLTRLIYGIFPECGKNKNVREELKRQIRYNGPEKLHAKLKNVDYESYKRIHPKDAKRIIRAWEVYIVTGKTITQLQKEFHKNRPPLKIKGVALIRDREELYKRINKRTKQMFKNGLIQEVIKILSIGYKSNIRPFESLAYKETIMYLKKELPLELAIHKAQQATRNFAKRQITWLRSMPFIPMLNITNLSFKEILQKTQKIMLK